MMLKIKFNIIIKKIYSYLNEVIKLSMIIYNKELQKKLNINIKNYIKFSKEKILTIDNEGNGEIRGIKDDNLYFKGKFLNKKKNGFGFEYMTVCTNYIAPKTKGFFITKITFGPKFPTVQLMNYTFLYYEGEYINGKKEGKGKEYDIDTGLEYEGNFINGKREGFGKEFGQNEKLIYEGEFKNGKREGMGKEYKNGVLIFEGEFKNDTRSRNGYRKEYDSNGNLISEGLYKNGKMWSGKFTEYDERRIRQFVGEYKNGKRSGKGKDYDKDGNLLWYIDGDLYCG